MLLRQRGALSRTPAFETLTACFARKGGEEILRNYCPLFCALCFFFVVTFRNSFIRSCCYSRSKFVAAAFSTARKRAKMYSAMQCFRFRSGASSCALFFSFSFTFFLYLFARSCPAHTLLCYELRKSLRRLCSFGWVVRTRADGVVFLYDTVFISKRAAKSPAAALKARGEKRYQKNLLFWCSDTKQKLASYYQYCINFPKR